MKRVRPARVILVAAGACALALLIAVGIAWHRYARFLATPLAIPQAGTTLTVERGASFKRIIRDITGQHLSRAPAVYWRVLAWRLGVVHTLDAGQYALQPGMTPATLLSNIAAGRVIEYTFTIVDGWTFKQVRAALAQAPWLVHDSSAMSGAQIMHELGAKDSNPEGWLLPQTYAYVKGNTDIDVLRRAYRAMHKVLHAAWIRREPDLPLTTPYQALILASIVEKETAQADERARIAGVFVRRLRLGMPLQTDPSVIYGLGSAYNGDITFKDLRLDTPYNTYLHRGLPPTPLAMPGKPAIEAALHPAKGKALYFVARGDGSGRHVFSATLAEQNRAVACYQLKRCSGQ